VINTIGNFGVGKTRFNLQFAYPELNSNIIRTYAEYLQRKIEIRSRVIEITIWDTCFRERFHSVPKGFYNRAQGIILAYDITNRVSFDSIEFWKKECEDCISHDMEYSLVGLKIDLNEIREVRKEEGELLAEKHNIPFFEISSNDNHSVECVFVSLASRILEKPQFQNQKAPLNIKQDRFQCAF